MRKSRIFQLLLTITFGLGIFFAIQNTVRAGKDDSPPRPSMYLVSTMGDDTPDCGHSGSYCRSIQYAINLATKEGTPGNQVRVAAGVYNQITTINGQSQVVYITDTIKLLGGYTEENWGIANPERNETTIDAQGKGRAVSIYTGPTNTVTLEGFHITGGNAGGSLSLGGGIKCVGNAQIHKNWIFGNYATQGGGIDIIDGYLDMDCKVLNNYIYNNSAIAGSAIRIRGGQNNTIDGNWIFENEGQNSTIYFSAANSVSFTNNIVNGNKAFSPGLYIYGGSVDITNNTIVSNSHPYSPTKSVGIVVNFNMWDDGEIMPAEVDIQNNIIAYHAIGIDGADYTTSTLDSNLFWENSIENWDPNGGTIGSENELIADPLFVNTVTKDYHITEASPARDWAPCLVNIDIDKQDRPNGPGCDVGADEWHKVFSIYLPTVIR